MPVTMLSYPLDTSKSSNRLGNLIVLVGLGVAICLMGLVLAIGGAGDDEELGFKVSCSTLD